MLQMYFNNVKKSLSQYELGVIKTSYIVNLYKITDPQYFPILSNVFVF